MTDRYVYDLSEGSAEMKPLLGGKGAGARPAASCRARGTAHNT